jgi:probable F420-dependent oxidoreductase
MTVPVRFALQVTNLELPRLRDVGQTAEGLGFDVLYLPDHIVHEGPERQHDPHHLSYDVMIQAAVLCEATRRARVGHLVLCNLFRHPVMTAQSLATLDHLSGGRVVAGLGAGWTETEFRMTGIPFPDIATRLRMLDEALTCMRALWTHEQATVEGEFYRLSEAILWPKPVQRPHPPIVLGGSGRGLLRVAARHADVVNIISEVGQGGYIAMAKVGALTDDAFRAKVRFLREEAGRHGRDGAAIGISNVCFTTIVTDSPDATRAMAESIGRMLRVPAEVLVRAPLALIGTPEECAAELTRRMRAWEVSEFVFPFTGEDTMRRLAEDVLPRVRAGAP